MKLYNITVSYRPNANSLQREEASFGVRAMNKQAAILRAGFAMCSEHRHFVPDSLRITVEQTGRWHE